MAKTPFNADREWLNIGKNYRVDGQSTPNLQSVQVYPVNRTNITAVFGLKLSTNDRISWTSLAADPYRTRKPYLPTP